MKPVDVLTKWRIDLQPTIYGWLLRDAVLITLFFLTLMMTADWGAIAAVIGFIFAYVVIYAVHEWGHLGGATLAQSHMPLAPYKSALIGYFDPKTHSQRQFLSLSWGGVLGYVLASSAMLSLYFVNPTWFNAGAAVAGLAFTVQSLAVDLPQIIKVHQGADPAATNAAGTQPKLIIRRTWQTWLPLAAFVFFWVR